MPLWDPFKPAGGAADPSVYAGAKMILWKGFCSVHQRFTVEQIDRARKALPRREGHRAPQNARWTWSTPPTVPAPPPTSSKEIANAPAGSAIAVGTEINLVNRLAAQYPDKTVFCLDPVVCPCSTMWPHPPGLPRLGAGEHRTGNIVNRITVDETTARDAKIALQRMLEVHP